VQGWIPNVPALGADLSNYGRADIYVELKPYNPNPFLYAAYGDQGVSIGGSDSYNSSLDPPGNFKLNHGDTGTNNTAAGSNSVGAPFDGIGYYPPGSSASVVSGSPTGGKKEDTRDNRGLFANVPVPPAGAIPIKYSSGKFVRQDNGYTYNNGSLPGGTYWVQGDVDAFEISATATPSSPVILYLDGNLDVGGNSDINQNGTPPCLLIYGTANCASVNMHGNGSIRAAVFAPMAAITLKGGGNNRWDIMGSFVGKTVVGSGSKTNFLYDESLASIGGGTQRYQLSSWTRIR
jgi:hypothetical protein